MADEAEVRTKMSLDDVQLRAGAASAKDVMNQFGKDVGRAGDHGSNALHKIHHALHGIKMMLHGLGAFAVIASIKGLTGEMIDFASELVFGGEQVRAKWEEVVKAIEKTHEAAKTARERAREGTISQLSPEDQITERQIDLREAQTDKAVAQGDIKQYNEYKDILKKVSKGELDKSALPEHTKEWFVTMETAEQRLYEATEKEQKAVKEIKALRDEIDRREREALEDRIRREEAFTKSVLAARNKANADLASLRPSSDELRKDGYTDKHGRFHRSEAAQMQMDIDDEKQAFKENQMAGVFANDASGAIDEANYIKGMEERLNQYLGKPQDIQQEMLKQVSTGVTVQQDILAIFTGAKPTI